MSTHFYFSLCGLHRVRVQVRHLTTCFKEYSFSDCQKFHYVVKCSAKKQNPASAFLRGQASISEQNSKEHNKQKSPLSLPWTLICTLPGKPENLPSTTTTTTTTTRTRKEEALCASGRMADPTIFSIRQGLFMPSPCSRDKSLGRCGHCPVTVTESPFLLFRKGLRHVLDVGLEVCLLALPF